MAKVFTRFEIYNRARGGAMLAWELHPLFELSTPLTFTIYASRSGVGDFVAVGTVVDDFSFEDTNRWIYGKNVRLHYQVRLVDGASKEAESEVKQAVGNQGSNRFQQIANEMIRKEFVRMELAGQCGWLYKKRRWGVKCPDCIDWSTEQVMDAKCDTCYGTGFTGGYFDPVRYWVSERSEQPRRQLTNLQRGFVDDQVMYVRGVNCPWIDKGDFWVDFDSDSRYVIETVKKVNFRGIPLFFDPVEFRLAPTTDIIYALPRPDDAS